MRYAQFSLHLDGTASSDSVIPKGLTLLKFKVYLCVVSVPDAPETSNRKDALDQLALIKPELFAWTDEFFVGQTTYLVKAPSSGLPLINTSGRCLFPPKGNRWKSSFAWLVESEFLPPSRDQSKGAKGTVCRFCERRRLPNLPSSSGKSQKRRIAFQNCKQACFSKKAKFDIYFAK